MTEKCRFSIKFHLLLKFKRYRLRN